MLLEISWSLAYYALRFFFLFIPGFFSAQYEILQLQVLNLYLVLHKHLLDDIF